jgi:hypothetical protein
MAQQRDFKPVRRDAGTTEAGRDRDRGDRRLTLVTAVQDAQRGRRKRPRAKRLVTIVPVSDYRDITG